MPVHRLTLAEKAESPCQPLGAGLGSWFRGVVEGGGDHAERMREAYVATRLLTGFRAEPPGIAAGRGLVPYFCGAVIMRVRAGAFGVIRGPRGVSGAFADVSRPRHSPRRLSCCRLTTLVVEFESTCIRGDAGGKGTGYPAGAG